MQITTFSGNEAVKLTWDEVDEILGHKHRGTPEDDETLITHLKSEGAPDWIDNAEGGIDEDGWYLYH